MAKRSPLENAIHRNDPERVQRLLVDDLSVLDEPIDGADPIFLATSLRRTDIVRVMIEAGADPNTTGWLADSTPIHLAASNGDIGTADLLLRHGADPNARDAQGMTPLHVRVEYHPGCEPAVIGLLVSRGADVDARDDTGKTPLHYAAFRSAADTDALIRAGADVNAATPDGTTPLRHAALGYNEEQIRLLAKAGADLDAPNEEGLTPLIEAVDRLNLRDARRLAKLPDKRGRAPKLRSAAEVLLDCGATLDVYSAAVLGRLGLVRRFVAESPELVRRRLYLGRTLLHASTRLAQRSLMKFLLDCGAEANARDDHGNTPLDSAAFWGHAQALEILLNKGASTKAKRGQYPPLYWAASMGRRRSALKLIVAGADVRTSLPDGRTALHAAAEKGLLDVVRELIRHGAQANATDQTGHTPLLNALEHGRDDLACFLIESNADVVGREDWHILHTAARHACAHAVKAMVSRGVSVNATDEEGATPMHEAAARDQIRIMATLTAAGAKINARDGSGRTPLHYAGADAAKWLIRAGADIEVRDKDGRTPLHSMSLGIDAPTLAILLRHGADINAIDNQGRTALHIVAADGDRDDLETLLKHNPNVNARDDKGCTPLGCALRARRRKTAQALRQRGGVE